MNGKQPVKVKAIVHWKDRRFKKILVQQETLGWDEVERSLLKSQIDNLERKSTKQQSATASKPTDRPAAGTTAAETPETEQAVNRRVKVGQVAA